jgi:hypothetical protein
MNPDNTQCDMEYPATFLSLIGQDRINWSEIEQRERGKTGVTEHSH